MTQNLHEYQLSSYDYELAPELIAQRPLKNREEAKLLVYHAKTGQVFHQQIKDIPSLLQKSEGLVFNRTKVFPSRLLVKKPTGGQGEIFFLEKKSPAKVLIKASGKRKVGEVFHAGQESLEVVELDPLRVKVRDFTCLPLMMPIPPYIRDGLSDQQDDQDYQTVFAQELGSVAAPTAGLHFSEDLLRKIPAKAFVTLHVGPGTFSPVRHKDIREHEMHQEVFCLQESEAEKIKTFGSVTAVGTTSLRVLESVRRHGLKQGSQSTELFLYPGEQVTSVEGLITNFHLPKSSLLMLVSALIGREKCLELYELAKEKHYRFYSYGDAMWIRLNV